MWCAHFFISHQQQQQHRQFSKREKKKFKKRLRSSSNYHHRYLLLLLHFSLSFFEKIFAEKKHNWVLNAKWVLWEHSKFSAPSSRIKFHTHLTVLNKISSLLRKTSRWISLRFILRNSSNAKHHLYACVSDKNCLTPFDWFAIMCTRCAIRSEKVKCNCWFLMVYFYCDFSCKFMRGDKFTIV